MLNIVESLYSKALRVIHGKPTVINSACSMGSGVNCIVARLLNWNELTTMPTHMQPRPANHLGSTLLPLELDQCGCLDTLTMESRWILTLK